MNPERDRPNQNAGEVWNRSPRPFRAPSAAGFAGLPRRIQTQTRSNRPI